MHRETCPAKRWRGCRGEEKEFGEDNAAGSRTSPVLHVLCTQQCQDPSFPFRSRLHTPFSVPQKPQVLQTSRHRAVVRLQAPSCCISSLSLNDLLPQKLEKPRNLRAPIGFAQFSLPQNVFVLRCRHTHPPVTGTLLASSAITIQSCPCSTRQEREKSRDKDCVQREGGSYKDKRSHLQSQPHQSMQKLNSLSFVLWFTEDDKSGELWLKICGKEGSQEKRPFLFLRGGIDSSIYFNYLQCFISF